jgi:hypothetical protein
MGIFDNSKKEKRFVEVYSEDHAGMDWLRIYQDKQTGVQYLWKQQGSGGGICPLLDKDGKPLINDSGE